MNIIELGMKLSIARVSNKSNQRFEKSRVIRRIWNKKVKLDNLMFEIGELLTFIEVCFNILKNDINLQI